MRISRAELFHLMGLEQSTSSPLSMVLESDDGTRQASVRWNDDEFSADMSECFKGEASELMFALEGTFHQDDDEFDLTARDRDYFDSDEPDIFRIAARFGRARAGMQNIES